MGGSAEELRRRFVAFLEALDAGDAGSPLEAARAYWSAANEAFWDRDPAGIVVLDPAHEIVNRTRQFTDWSEVYRGEEGVWRYLDELKLNTERGRFEIEEVHDAGARVALLGTIQVTARHTGIEFEMPWAYILTIRDRAITRTEMFDDQEAALAALEAPAEVDHR